MECNINVIVHNILLIPFLSAIYRVRMPVIDLAHTKYTWLYYFGPISSHFWDSWLKIMNKMINKLEFEFVLTEVGGSLKLSFK